MGPTGNPTTPKRWFMPCCLRLLATNVAPSTSAMLFLLSDGRTRHVRWRRTRRTGAYAFMLSRGRDPASIHTANAACIRENGGATSAHGWPTIGKAGSAAISRGEAHAQQPDSADEARTPRDGRSRRFRRSPRLRQRRRAGRAADLGRAHLAGAGLVRSGRQLGDYHAFHGALCAARCDGQTDAGTTTGAEPCPIVVRVRGWAHL